jgi:hypothetical protein
VSLFASPFSLPATIQAVTDADLLAFRPSVVQRAAERDARVARALIDELSERVLSFIGEIPGSAFATLRQRVARHLLDLASEGQTGPELVAAVGQQDLADAVGTVREEVLLAYEVNGRALEPQHGFPLRLIVPGWYGMTSVKWLTAIEVVTEPFEGCQQTVALPIPA